MTKKTVDIHILTTSTNRDRKTMQPLRKTSGTLKKIWNVVGGLSAEGGGLEPPTKFSKMGGEGLHRNSTFREGLLRKRG